MMTSSSSIMPQQHQQSTTVNKKKKNNKNMTSSSSSSSPAATKKKRYVTLKDGGCDFRKMAKIMTDAGYKMNHATARNQLILAVESLISGMSSELRIKMARPELQELVTSQALQDNLADVLFIAYQDMLIEKQQK